MPEETIFAAESERSRSDVAALLRQVADNLDAGEDVTLSAGGESVTLSPPERVTFETKVEEETGAGPAETSVEFELEWEEGSGTSDGELRVE
ncbi:amphi-Trp domain-containing protein [Halarchaeum sp. P4]|uniref:amphi-Trp domain-containing protein n=1 Tax=Halarchaeum sp. P4 TaxID=3421639 RepID=UPI003EC0B388